MFDKIGPEDITVQVEIDSSDNSIPEGIAVSSGVYDIPLYAGTTPVTQMGMNKSGNLTTNDTWTDVTGWVARSGYPSTVIDANKSLVVGQSGSVIISVAANFSPENSTSIGWFTLYTYRSRGFVRILKNDIVIASGSGTTLVTLNKVTNVIAGDKIKIQVKGAKASSFSDYPTLQGTNSNLVFHNYDNSAIDFEEDMVYGSDKGFFDDTWGRYVSSTYLKKGLPQAISGAITLDDDNDGENSRGSLELSRGNAAGPILAQTRHPIPVFPSSKVNFAGVFRVRQTGSKDEQTESGIFTGLRVRFSIWGVGLLKDEYGVETLQSQELMFYQVTLQSAQSESTSMIEYTLPTISDATVPATGVDYIFFTVSLVQDQEEHYSAGTFTDKKSGPTVKDGNKGPVAPPASTSSMKYFGWSHTNPLVLTIKPPTTMRRVTTHPLSRTEVAYKNTEAEFFTNVKTGAQLTFFGMPGASAAINVYNYNDGAQGTLIGSFSALANERKTVTINPTGDGGIRVVKSGANDVFVESIVNPVSDTLSQIKTRQKITNFLSINSDITKISVLREEGDTCSITIDFDSDDLDPLVSSTLSIGKTIRFIGRHYGVGDLSRPESWVGEANYTTIFTGVIKQVKTEYDYEDNPIIQVIAYDANDQLERSKVGVAFDTFEKYIPILNRMGISALTNSGFDVGGVYKEFPQNSKYVYRPSAHGDFSLAAGIEMTRNTNKSYVIVTRSNSLKMFSEISETPVLTFTDGTDVGDISYGKLVKKQDTNAIVNKLDLNENALDAKDYKERSFGQESGPPSDFRYVATKKRTATFHNEESAKLYGEFARSFDVIRGDGDLKKLYRSDLGESFQEWADSFLATHGTPQLQIHEFTIPMKNSNDIRMISQLELLDLVTVIYKGETYNLRIREIEHTVRPGKWFVVLKFTPQNEMTTW